MLTKQLSEYIIRNLKKGYTIDSLRFSLINQGYTKITIENAIEMANKKMAEEIPSMKEKPEIMYKVFVDNKEMMPTRRNDIPGIKFLDKLFRASRE